MIDVARLLLALLGGIAQLALPRYPLAPFFACSRTALAQSRTHSPVAKALANAWQSDGKPIAHHPLKTADIARRRRARFVHAPRMVNKRATTSPIIFDPFNGKQARAILYVVSTKIT